ncbi:MAG: class I SAM-dependent methyltransferase [Bacteroidota bacterium]
MVFRWKLAQWLELKWWKNYLSDKSKEEYLTWKKNYWKAILNKVSELTEVDSSKTVCDLGCGPAGIFIAFPVNKVTCVDPLIDVYEKQTSFFRKVDYSNATFVQSTMEEFLVKEKFDLVFCMNAINHVRDIAKGFDKLEELCADGGSVILSIDAHNLSLFKYLFRLLPGDFLHPHQYDLAEYKLFLEKRGMKVLKTELLKKEFFFDHYLIIAQK